MRTPILPELVTPDRSAEPLQHDAAANALLLCEDASLDLKRDKHNLDRRAQHLVWILIGLLLCLTLAAAYLFWAKTQSAWPFSHWSLQ